MVETPAKSPHDVPIRLAVRVRGAVVERGRADLRERAGRLEARRRKIDPLERDRQLDVR
jgi:hypothetical protein